MSTGDSVRVIPHDSNPPRVPDDRSHRQHSTDSGDRGDHGNRWNPHQREGKRPVPFLEASGVRDGGYAPVVPRRIYQGYRQDHAGLPSPFRRGMKPSVRVISSACVVKQEQLLFTQFVMGCSALSLFPPNATSKGLVR